MGHELKVGDKVVIRRDLKINEHYSNDVRFASDMSKYLGTTQVIRCITLDGDYRLQNPINGDFIDWYWTKEMFDWPETYKVNGWENEESKTNSKEEMTNLKGAGTNSAKNFVIKVIGSWLTNDGSIEGMLECTRIKSDDKRLLDHCRRMCEKFDEAIKEIEKEQN